MALTRAVWDVVVIGSGPGGAAAAIGALSERPGASVLMLDRSDFPRDKSCGDGVLAHALDLLDEHGVDAQALVRGYRASPALTVQDADGTVTAVRSLPVPIIILPRRVFDDRLRTAACAAGATWRRHTVRSVRDMGTHVEVDGEIRARVVIGADGAESIVRRAVVAAGTRREIAIAIRGYEDGGMESGADGMPRVVLDKGHGLAYAWRFPCAAGPANVGYGYRLEPGETTDRRRLLATMQRLMPDANPDSRTLQAHRLPLSTSKHAVASGRILLVGDAASLINPVSGEGIYYAISSGLHAGRAAARDPARAGTHYRTVMRRRFATHHVHADLMSRMIRWDTVLRAGLRAAHNSQQAFDDLTLLCLGTGRITPSLAARMSLQMLAAADPRAAFNAILRTRATTGAR